MKLFGNVTMLIPHTLHKFSDSSIMFTVNFCIFSVLPIQKYDRNLYVIHCVHNTQSHSPLK